MIKILQCYSLFPTSQLLSNDDFNDDVICPSRIVSNNDVHAGSDCPMTS